MNRVSAGPKHPNTYKTLNLLKLYDSEGKPVFFVVIGYAFDDGTRDALDQSYLYNTHTCPTNYVNCEAIMQVNDPDPHGVFDYVRSVWMPEHYEETEDKDDLIIGLFPEINQDSQGA